MDAPFTNEIDFESKSENLSLVENMIEKACADYQVGEDSYGNMLIAVTEAVNNAIFHGNHEDPSKNIKVGLKKKDEETLLFVVKDEGAGFDFDNLPDPTDPANIEKENGRGVFLMKNLADEVTFENNGSQVELKFILN